MNHRVHAAEEGWGQAGILEVFMRVGSMTVGSPFPLLHGTATATELVLRARDARDLFRQQGLVYIAPEAHILQYIKEVDAAANETQFMILPSRLRHSPRVGVVLELHRLLRRVEPAVVGNYGSLGLRRLVQPFRPAHVLCHGLQPGGHGHRHAPFTNGSTARPLSLRFSGKDLRKQVGTAMLRLFSFQLLGDSKN